MSKQTLKEYSKKMAGELAKAFSKVNLKEVKGEGEFEVIATTEGTDRDGEVIMVKGWDFENFMKNPVVLFGHDYWSLPIGAVTSIDVQDDKVVAKGVFARTEEGQKARMLYEDGILRTVSVGFIPKERNGNVITKAELLELSFVPVPSNPEALDMRKALDDFKKVLETSLRIQKSVVPYKEYDRAPEDTEWDADAATEAVAAWATEGEGEEAKINFEKYKEAFAWFDSEQSDTQGAYKLPHHTVIDGNLVTVWQGVAAAMAALLGARGGTDMPEEDMQAVYDHLAKHYAEFEKEPPELKAYTQYELDNLFPSEKNVELDDDQRSQIDYITQTLRQDVNNLVTDAVEKIGTVMGEKKIDVQPISKAGRVLSSKTRTTITNAVEAMGQAVKELKELLKATDSTQEDEEKELHESVLKMLQSIDKTVENGIVKLKNRIR